MPARPWQILDQAEPQRDYLVQLSYLPLVRYRSLPRFGRWLLAIQKQLSQAEGVIGYSLLTRPLKREFWTLSAWSDRWPPDLLLYITVGIIPRRW